MRFLSVVCVAFHQQANEGKNAAAGHGQPPRA
jgi:hypothetical protein